jgi:hypothetical protein
MQHTEALAENEGKAIAKRECCCSLRFFYPPFIKELPADSQEVNELASNFLGIF